MHATWPISRLGELCVTGSGGTPLKERQEFYEGGTIPWILSGEVAQGDVLAASNFITERGLAKSSAKLFPIDTVLVAMYGATAGQVGILRFEAATNQAVCGILPSEHFIPEFLYYFLLSKKDELVAQATGNAQPNISQFKIRNTEVPVPSKHEQQRIVGILDQAFAAIATAKANAEKNLQNARALFETYRESILMPGKDGWLTRRLSDLCEIKHGFAFKSEFFGDTGEYVLLTPGNFYESGGYRDRGEKQKYYCGEIPKNYILDHGDLLLAMTEQAAGLLGSPILVPESDRFLHNQRLGLVVQKPGIPWTNEFFFNVFNTKPVRAEIHASASGVKVRHTSPSKIGEVAVSFPASISEQNGIVAKLNSITLECRELEIIYQQKIEKLASLKQSVLHHAFTGEI
jgi:type I restriction enzyme S subunit